MFEFIKNRFLQGNKASGKKGYWFDDPFLSYIKGYTEINKATRDVIQLHNEIETTRLSIVPLHEEDKFLVVHPNPNIQKVLHNHFFNKYQYRRNIYGQAHDFGQFLQFIAYSLLTDGLVFYAIDWDKEEIDKQIFTLPKFRYLSTATMNIRQIGKSRKYIQEYSLLFWLSNKHNEGKRYQRSFVFNSNEVFYLRYHFSKESPTKQCLKYIPQLERFWGETMLRYKAIANPEDISLAAEKVRYQNLDKVRRNNSLLRAKVRGIFNCPERDLKYTSYYDVYQVVKQKKFLNDFRCYIIDEFNNQIMKNLSELNNLSIIPLIKEQGIMTNKELDEWHQKYTSGEITLDNFISKVISYK
ncbi:hypothetical protein KKC91_07525 [bacterium]|nr:hypothetical protein [bacterium]